MSMRYPKIRKNLNTFHRLFTAYTGLPLMGYIKWLRLKRAAHQLIVHKEETIINIALDAGF